MTLADVMLSDTLASSAFSGFHGGMSDSSCPALMDPRLPLPCLPRRSCLSAADSTCYSNKTEEACIITWLVVQFLTSVSSIDTVFLTSVIFLTFKFGEKLGI